MRKASPPRLSRTDWVKAGFRALVRHGSGWRLEDLTQELGVSKGSFYWHFNDLAALRSEMLVAWEGLATADLSRFVTKNAAPSDRLRLLVEMVSILPPDDLGGAGIEPALRDWARSDSQAAGVVAAVDRQRLVDLTLWVRQAGIAPDKAPHLALSLYAQIIGLMALRVSHPLDMAAQLHALLDLALSPRRGPDQTDSA